MSKYINPKSIDTYLSGISFRLQTDFPDVIQIRNSAYIKNLMKGIKRQHGSTITRKEPIQFNQLQNLSRHYRRSGSYDDKLFLALILSGFFGLLRLGELVDSNDARLVNRRKTITRASLQISSLAASFTLPSSKTDRFFAGNKIMVHSNGLDNDPVVAINKYITSRDRLFPQLPWLWVTSNGTPPTCRWFLNRFHLHFDAQYRGHSMRAGGATTLAQNGMPFDIIQTLGRWSSEAFRIYIRTHPSLLHSGAYANIF